MLATRATRRFHFKGRVISLNAAQYASVVRFIRRRGNFAYARQRYRMEMVWFRRRGNFMMRIWISGSLRRGISLFLDFGDSRDFFMRFHSPANFIQPLLRAALVWFIRLHAGEFYYHLSLSLIAVPAIYSPARISSSALRSHARIIMVDFSPGA